MKIAIAKETIKGENRVAASPESVKKFTALKAEVFITKGAGLGSNITDEAFKDAGAKIVSEDEAFKDADVVLFVNYPSEEQLKKIKKGALLVGALSPYDDKDRVKSYASAGVDAITMEFIPRTTRAQSMDMLSSQANLAGYRAVLEAAYAYGHAFPMFMTAAGSISPAKVFVMGAGVAGLQAIATAKRLGAQVSATDVRPAVKEEVQSLGANFVMVESEETAAAQTSGGYAKEMSDDYKKKQAELIAETIKKQDIVITTALIPGRKAPTLVTDEMIASMKAGSVIIDMAVERGGNVTASKLDEVVVTANGVKVVGYGNLPSRMADDASKLYAKNLLNLLSPFINKENGEFKLNLEDDIVQGSMIVRGGEVVHPNLK